MYLAMRCVHQKITSAGWKTSKNIFTLSLTRVRSTEWILIHWIYEEVRLWSDLHDWHDERMHSANEAIWWKTVDVCY